MVESKFSALRRDHADIRRLIARLRLVEAELNGEQSATARLALDDVVADLVRLLYRSMRDEERVVYPLVERALGSDVPVLALLADHRAIRETVRTLQSLRRPGPGAPDPGPQLRRETRRLAQELEMHLRREEAAFGALAPGRSTVVV